MSHICPLPSVGYRRDQFFLNFKVQRKLLEYQMKPINIHASISSHLNSRIGKNIDILEQPDRHIKISCLPRDPFLNRSWHRWNYFHWQIKISKKYEQAITLRPRNIICLHCHWKFTRSAFLFIDHQYTEITYFSFKRLLLTLILVGSFSFSWLNLSSNCIIHIFFQLWHQHSLSNWNS